MTQNTYPSTNGCCFEPCGFQLNPLEVKNTVAAGSVCMDLAEHMDGGCMLAMAYMPMQHYRAGYCPDEALSMGTLLPELVRPYC